MEAVEHLIKRNFKPTRTVYLAYGHDEEIGGKDGAKQVRLKSKIILIKFAWEGLHTTIC